MSLSSLRDEEIRDLRWYYKVELRKDVFTEGQNFKNIVATKHLLRKIDFQQARLLDIGVMEGALPVLLERAGAKVTAYDRLDFTDRINLVKEAYGVYFEYYPGKSFHEFATQAQLDNLAPFDIVNMSGVLYHVIDPMLFLYSLPL